MTQTVEEATKALWDYINGLPPEQRAKAIEYQKGLEAEAASTEGGMMAVIPRRLKHNAMALHDCLVELQEEAAGVAAEGVLLKYRL